MPRPRRFTALVQDGHKGCAVEVPFDATEVWGIEPGEIVYGKVRGVPVSGILAPENAQKSAVPFASWIVFRWGKHWLLLDDDALDDAGLAPGQNARVEVAPRAAPPPLKKARRKT